MKKVVVFLLLILLGFSLSAYGEEKELYIQELNKEKIGILMSAVADKVVTLENGQKRIIFGDFEGNIIFVDLDNDFNVTNVSKEKAVDDIIYAIQIVNEDYIIIHTDFKSNGSVYNTKDNILTELSAAAAGDIDGDGKRELIEVRENNIIIHYDKEIVVSLGDIFQEKPGRYFVTYVKCFDLEGDKKDEIIFSSGGPPYGTGIFKVDNDKLKIASLLKGQTNTFQDCIIVKDDSNVLLVGYGSDEFGTLFDYARIHKNHIEFSQRPWMYEDFQLISKPLLVMIKGKVYMMIFFQNIELYDVTDNFKRVWESKKYTAVDGIKLLENDDYLILGLYDTKQNLSIVKFMK